MRQVFRLLRLPQSYRRMRRVRKILGVLARHGFADLVTRSGTRGVWRALVNVFTLGRQRDVLKLTTGERLRRVFEELGPTFIKFGQMLATRRDLLPESVVVQLAHLQDDVPVFPLDSVLGSLEQQWGRTVVEVFEELSPVPIAAASIAQVHRGTLLDGSVVAVKVRRPGIEAMVREDLAVLRSLAGDLDQSVPEWRHLRLPEIVEEFARTILLELDFVNEVRNIQRFAHNFSDMPEVIIPGVHEAYCTRDVIVMEFIHGVKIQADTCYEELQISRRELADVGVRVLLRSVFVDRFFHADPHPGNFLVTTEGKVAMLDFGMMGQIDAHRMREMLTFMVALVSQDGPMLVEAMLGAGLAPEDLDRRCLLRDVERMMGRYTQATLKNLNMEQLIREATEVVFRHRIRLPADLLMVGRAIATMEANARQMDPEFVPLDAVRPQLMSIFLRQGLDPTPVAEEVTDRLFDWFELVGQLPREISDVLDRAKRGELKVRIERPDLEHELEEARRRSNRMVVAMVGLGGSTLSLAALEYSQVVPGWLSVTFLAASGILVLWSVWGVVRSGGV